MSKANPIYLKLSTVPEERDEEKKEITVGKFKLCFSVFKDKLAQLFMPNLFLILCIVPALLVYMIEYPQELATISASYNFMGSLGVGYPGVFSSYSDGMVVYYQSLIKIVLMMAAAVVVLAPAIAGFNYVSRKFLQKDTIANTKDVFRCFFVGVKKYWLNTLLTVLMSVIVALGATVAILYHLGNMTAGTADAGSWVLFVAAIVIGAPLALLPEVMLPMSVYYKLTFPQILKNSLILLLKCWYVFVPVGIICALPLVLMFAVPTLTVIFATVWIMCGLMLTLHVWNAAASFAFDLYMNPVYEQLQAPQGTQTRKKQKQNSYVNPKKKGKK